MSEINTEIPAGVLAERQTNYKNHQELVSPANKRPLNVIVVGTSLAGASAVASLGELGFNVLDFCIRDSPRRAHSITTQSGINAVKNYQNDDDSVYRPCYDTIEGDDCRVREADVYRFAEVSNEVIDQRVAQGVLFACEYGRLPDNRSFGGVQVSRTFYARGQTGQQLLPGIYSALSRQVYKGSVKLYIRHGMLDLVIIDDRIRDIITHNLITGVTERFVTHAIVIATDGYGDAFCLTTDAIASNGPAAWQYYEKGAYFGNPCMTQIHPARTPEYSDSQSRLTLMPEPLRNDGRIWVPKKLEDAKALRVGTKKTNGIPEEGCDLYLERHYPAFSNLVPRDVASRTAKEHCDTDFGVDSTRLAVFLDFRYAIERMGHDAVADKCGNLFRMCEQTTADNPYETPMVIYPVIHYMMGSSWVDYELQTTIPGLFAIGGANFPDHGANHLGVSVLMQGLADGCSILPCTMQNYLPDRTQVPRFGVDHREFDEVEKALKECAQHIASIRGKHSVSSIHKELGHIMWEYVDITHSKEGLQVGIEKIKALRKVFWSDLRLLGNIDDLNIELGEMLRLVNFLETGELVAHDALDHGESYGEHFHVERQAEEGEVRRDDESFAHVSCWEYQGEGQNSVMHEESLVYEFTECLQRSYKN